MPGNANTYVFFVVSSWLLGIRGFMMQKIVVLCEKRAERIKQDEEKRRNFKME
jgi:hypothetical protein